MQLRSQVDDQAKIIGRLQEAQDLIVNEMAKMKEVLASLQQSSQSRSSSSPPVSALHSTSQTLSPNSTTSSQLYKQLIIVPQLYHQLTVSQFYQPLSGTIAVGGSSNAPPSPGSAGPQQKPHSRQPGWEAKCQVSEGSLLWRGSHAPMHSSWHEGPTSTS